MAIDFAGLQEILTLLIAVIAAIYAWYQKQQANDATKATATVIGAFTSGSGTSIKEAEKVADIPGKSWKMDDATKKYITFDVKNEATKADILKQVAEHEAAGDVVYVINVPWGDFQVEYGLIKGASGAPKDAGM